MGRQVSQNSMRFVRPGESLSNLQFLGRRLGDITPGQVLGVLGLTVFAFALFLFEGNGLPLWMMAVVLPLSFLLIFGSSRRDAKRFSEGREIIATVRLELPPQIVELQPIAPSSNQGLRKMPMLISADGDYLFFTNLHDGETIQWNTLAVVCDSTSSGRVGSLQIIDTRQNSVRLPILTASRLPLTGGTFN